jgi:hypothetical protein
MNPLHAQVQYKDVLQEDPFLPWTSVMKFNDVPEVSEGNMQHSWLSLVPRTIIMHPSASQKMVLMDLLRALFSYSFSWEMLCNVFHLLLFCFWVKVMELAFLTCYDAMKKTVAFNSTLFQQLQ